MTAYGIVAALLVGGAADGPTTRPPESAAAQYARVERQVRAWQPTAAERRFDEVGWVAGLRDAVRLAKRHGRPVFLFTHDGHMNVGRC